MRAILVTGGAGFIGSNFVQTTLAGESGIGRVVVLDKLTYAGNPANLDGCRADSRFHFVHGNIMDRALVARLLREHDITAIVHFAAESHVDRSIDSPDEFIQTNVVGTLALLQSARDDWLNAVPSRRAEFRFVHVSTDEVYGSLEPRDSPFSETTAYAPNSPYAASKAGSDHLVRAFFHTYGLPVIITNCSNNYGPYQFPEKLIPLVILNALRGKPLPIYGDGGNVRDWLYVEDHCEALRRVLAAGKPGEVYNIGGNSERTNLEVVEALCALLDQMQPRQSGSYAELTTFVKDRPGHDRRYAINSEKITRELEWSPQENFTSGLEKTVRWYLEHSEWYEAIERRTYQGQRLGLTRER